MNSVKFFSVLFLTIAIVSTSAIAVAGQLPADSNQSKVEISANKAVKQEVQDANEVSGTPKLVFIKIEHNLGEVGPGTSHSLSYEFKNEGDGTLKISKIHAPCGCTVPTLKKKVYKPGESGKIDVKFRAAKSGGAITKHIYIHSNDKKLAKYELAIKSKVVLKVKATPKVINLVLNKPNADAKPIVLESTDGKKFSVTKVSTAGNVAEFEFDPKKKAQKLTIMPKFDIEKLRNRLTGVIMINLSHPDCKTVMVRYNTPPEFTISPRAIIQTNADRNKPSTRTLWITSNYDKEIKIDSVASKKGTVKILSQKQHGNRYEIKVQLTTPDNDKSKPAKRYHSDELYIQIADGPKLTVRCQQWFPKEKQASLGNKKAG